MKEKDMYLPVWVCGLGVFLIAVAVAGVVLGVILSSIWAFLGAALCLGTGIFAILCWKNQWIKVLNEREFVYSTLFGTQTTYRFTQITGLKQNSDSMTLLMDGKKVHIESCAVVSERLAASVNQILDRISRYERKE